MDHAHARLIDTIRHLVDVLEPVEALEVISTAARDLLQQLDADTRATDLLNLLHDNSGDKTASLVHLWMAKCLDEGVDLTQMCQSLVERVNRSEILKSIVEPELLGLFEDWLEELEDEVRVLLQTHGPLNEDRLAQQLGLSRRGARFLLSKVAQGWIMAGASDPAVFHSEILVSAQEYMASLHHSEGCKNPDGLKGGVSGVCKAVCYGIGQ